MKTLLAISLFTLAFSASAVVTKDIDQEQGCTLISILGYKQDSKELERALRPSEKIQDSKVHYGFRFENLEVDFDSREVRFEVMARVALGLDYNVLGGKKKVSLDSDHPNFKSIVNMVNRTVMQEYTQICIDQDKKIIYAK